MRTLYDSVTANNIPKSATLVAGYVDGNYKWSAKDWARFPNSVKLQIAVHANTVADVLDVEVGNDMVPTHWVTWAKLARTAGRTPIIYMNTATWAQVRHAFLSRGVPEPLYWVAQYDNIKTVPAGAIAKQYADVGPYDLSVVVDHIPGVDPAPKPKPKPTPVPVPKVRRNDMHADLVLNKPLVFTNPAAVLGGTSTLLLASDFGDATVRVAVYSFKAKSWAVDSHVVKATAGASRISLPGDTNKVSVEVTAGSAPVGLDVLA